MTKHDAIQEIKRVAVELDRTPTKAEFFSTAAITEYQINLMFRNYTLFCQAAGITAYNERAKAKKIDNSIFERSLDAHLSAQVPRELGEQEPYPRIAILPDVHFPWENHRVLDAFYSYIAKHQPDHVVQIGDLYDCYSHAKFPRSHNVFLPKEESEISRRKAVEMWAEIRKSCPKSELHQILGNHDIRPLKRILEVYPEAEDWIKNEVHKLLTFDGVKTIFDPRQELIIGNVALFHGHRSQLGAHRDYTLMNCIVGHAHVGGVVYRQMANGRIVWELNSGLAGDPEGKGLTYTAQRISKWTPGFGATDEYGPRFIPVQT